MPFCPICGSEYEQGIEKCIDCNSLLVEHMPPQNPDAEPDATLVEVYEAAGDKEALIIKGLLESEGIMCSLSSDIPHTVVPLNINGLGAVRITVSQRDAERAKEIIFSNKRESGEE
ncbi:MAG: DUF2007 domain-containing protein [Candidatus Hydrogenedentota bacterium]|nr:MAG: DUF2007 domain-containing protein [Candidatus Hydrogenedentota bacterium]